MASKRIPKRGKKRKQKVNHSTPHAPLCALGEVLKEQAVFEPIHQTVEIHQKTIVYRPTDKLVFITVGIIAGAETISEINTALRPHRPLLLAFGYRKCADQSVIQQTLNATTPKTVSQLQQAVGSIWERHHLIGSLISPLTESEPLLIDMDPLGTAGLQTGRGGDQGVRSETQKSIHPPTRPRVNSPYAGDCHAIPLPRQHFGGGGVQRDG